MKASPLGPSLRACVLAALGAQVLAGLVLLLGHSPVRTVVMLAWALAVPGFAVVVHFRLDAAMTVALSVVVSIALGVLIAQVLVWSGVYDARLVGALLSIVTLVGLAAVLWFGPLLRPEPEPAPLAAHQQPEATE